MNRNMTFNEEIRQPMVQMMSRGEVKIGESGPVNWINCRRSAKNQLKQSIWNPNKLQHKQKIEGRLLQQRDDLRLQKDHKRSVYALLPFVSAIMIILIIMTLGRKKAYDDNDNDENFAIRHIYILMVLFLIFACLPLQSYFMSKMRDKVQTSICFMNQQLSNEGLNVTVVLKQKTPWPSIPNFSYFEIYERTDY